MEPSWAASNFATLCTDGQETYSLFECWVGIQRAACHQEPHHRIKAAQLKPEPMQNLAMSMSSEPAGLGSSDLIRTGPSSAWCTPPPLQRSVGCPGTSAFSRLLEDCFRIEQNVACVEDSTPGRTCCFGCWNALAPACLKHLAPVCDRGEATATLTLRCDLLPFRQYQGCDTGIHSVFRGLSQPSPRLCGVNRSVCKLVAKTQQFTCERSPTRTAALTSAPNVWACSTV